SQTGDWMSIRWVVLGVAMLAAGVAGAQALEAKLGPDVRAQLSAQERVRVLVMFELDAAAGEKAGAARRTAEIGAVRESLLAGAKAARGTLALRRAFLGIPGFAAEV